MTDTENLIGIENALYGVGSVAGTLKRKVDSIYTELEVLSYDLDELHCMVVAVREDVSKQLIEGHKEDIGSVKTTTATCKWFWMTDFCRDHGLPPDQEWAWGRAEAAYGRSKMGMLEHIDTTLSQLKGGEDA